MGSKLVIVESPAKAKTIGGILGRGYRVRASMGHIRDLPRKALGVDTEKGFRPHYVAAPRKKKTIEALKKAAADADALYLATDLDREGEAIAWHVLQVVRRALPKGTPVHRVTFHEITKDAVARAFSEAGTLNRALVEAQQTRRILDRLVGYSISPLLWRRIRGAKGLSAGRVQTAALRLVVDREREIDAFVPVEYWSIEALLAQQTHEPAPFLAQLWRIYDEKGVAHEPDLRNRADAQAIVDALESAAYWVDRVETAERSRSPWPPFTTSTMQQAASKALGYSPALTMRVAQQLYEGVPIGEEGTVGLITYMRTDSTYVAPEAQQTAREVIARYWGEEYLPAQPPTYRTRVKSAQEAHEAIRPTGPERTPKALRAFLDEKQAALYELIWRRFVASQMKPALYRVTTAYIPTGAGGRVQSLPYLFRAQGRECLFPGFLKVYEELLDEGEEGEGEQALPPLSAGEGLDLLQLIPKQHWTKPPPRYTESTLIKELERRGIGRPSTFAGMVSLIRDRGYVERQKRVLVPTELGYVVCDLLVEGFPELFDYGFTAAMEDQLDAIASGRAERVPTLGRFWASLEPALEHAKEAMPAVTLRNEKPEPTGKTCPECGGELVRRKGKSGYFTGCANYPKCKYIERESRGKAQPTHETCPECGGALVRRMSRYGPFLGCSNYPTCRYTAKVDTAQDTPQVSDGQ